MAATRNRKPNRLRPGPHRKNRYAWMLVAQKNCRDCIRRSGMGARLYSAWSRIGLPGSGFSVCGQYCGCVLVLAEEGSATEGVKGITIEDYLPDDYDSLTPREQEAALKAAAKLLREDVQNMRGLILDID